MFSRLHSRLGTAGFVVAIVALVAAVAGTAFAATGLNSKQKKEVKAIAKSVAGTGAAGPAGPAGPAGAPGAAGAAGQNGVSATASAFTGNKGNCTDGGVEVKSAGPDSLICNGKKGAAGADGQEGPPGDPWTAGGTLPPNATETGTWGASFTEVGFAPISFPVPLANPLAGNKTQRIAEGETPPAECDNGVAPPPSVANPEADPGFVCVYVGAGEPTGEVSIGAVSNPATGQSGAAVAGASLLLQAPGPAFMIGTFAVTAPVNP